MKIRRNDNVVMLSGKDRGKKGKILAVLFSKKKFTRSGSIQLKENKVVVEGLNLIKRHIRARKQGQKGQIISKERPVNISSVALVCRSCGKPTRVGYKIKGENKVRICKKCGAEA